MKGHGRARCPKAAATENGGGEAAHANYGGGGWETSQNTGSAQAAWEQAETPTFGGPAPVASGW